MIALGLLFSFGMPAAAETVPAWRSHLPIPIATLREAFEHWDRDLAGEPFVAVLSGGIRLDHPEIDWKTLRDLQRYVQARFDWSPLTPLAIDMGLIRSTDSDRLGMMVLLLYAKWKGSSGLQWDGITWPAAVLDARAERREDLRPSPIEELDVLVEEFFREEEDEGESSPDAPHSLQ